MQVREVAAQQRHRVDEHVLTLARHEAADADDELAVDAEAGTQRRRLVAARRHVLVHRERRTQDLRGHGAARLLARGVRRVLAHRQQHRGLAEHVAQRLLTPGTAPGSVTSAPPRKTT